MMPAVRQQYPQIKFCLAGYPVREARRRVLELGVENAVLLPGEVPYFQLPKFLAAADIALEPKVGSSGEASGKLMHYMVALLPVVCFKTPNNLQLLGEDAVYASEETEEAFKEALCRIIESEALRTRLQLQMRTRSYSIKEEASHAKVLVAVYAPMIPKEVMA
jgi:glycosyltransferase involved in cell wall biosynthesis